MGNVTARRNLRSAFVAAVTLVLSPSAYAQQTVELPGVRMIDLDGRAVRVQTIGLQDRRPGAPVIVFEAGASNALEIWGGILPQIASMAGRERAPARARRRSSGGARAFRRAPERAVRGQDPPRRIVV